ncbi:MAG TPA: VanW family protein [Candidatus Saccharimonadales bacterium]|nr:VanW family protein [Candidatus Saccharimonadales bacterium]
MFNTLILALAVVLSPVSMPASGSPSMVIASEQMNMNERYGNTFVNDVFKDNILLTLNYMNGKVTSAKDINWSEIEKPATYEFTLKPGEEFAFHGDVLPEYKGKVAVTTKAHFNYTDGFKSDGYLTGDGVCHLASLVYWVAKDANLEAVAPTNHNFAVIQGIDRKYGVGIYDNPTEPSGSGMSNLYIKNTKNEAIKFVFEYKDSILKLSIVSSK